MDGGFRLLSQFDVARCVCWDGIFFCSQIKFMIITSHLNDAIVTHAEENRNKLTMHGWCGDGGLEWWTNSLHRTRRNIGK